MSSTSLPDLAKEVCEILKENNIEYALAGGIIADIYRGEPRATDDIDLLVAIDESDINQATSILNSLGFTPSIITESMLKGDTRFRRKSKRDTPQIIVGRDHEKPFGVDFLLLTFPWALNALKRSKQNMLKLIGANPVPCLTVEDMIISKLFAIKNNSTRRYKKSDIPDIALMLENNSDVDLNYLSDSMEKLELILPKGVEAEAPPILSRLSRKIRKRSKSFDY